MSIKAAWKCVGIDGSTRISVHEWSMNEPWPVRCYIHVWMQSRLSVKGWTEQVICQDRTKQSRMSHEITAIQIDISVK